MSKLDELINELCPDGVEWKRLNSICGFQNGFAFKSNKFSDKGLPILRITNINSGELSKDGYICFNEQDYKENLDQYKVTKDCVVIAMSGATTGKIGFNYSDNTYYLNQRVGKFNPFKEKLNNRYLYHWLLSKSTEILNISSGTGAQPNLSSVKMMDFLIPLPPLPVQEEIVRILDNFTELTKELTKELTARKKQYEYYRDSLLTFGNKMEWKTLGEISTITRGGNFQKKDFTETGVQCIHYGQIYTKYGLYANETFTFINKEVAAKSKFASKNNIVMAVTSENIEDVCKCVVWLGENDVAISGHTAIIKHNQNPKFLAYYFQTAMFFKDKIKLAHGTKVIEVTPSKLADVKIPIPSLPEQQRIVDILDRFDTLCNDISSGLPAEIRARQQQYEYYRDKLLTFNNIDAKEQK